MRRTVMLLLAAAAFAAPMAANAQRAWALDGADVFAGPGNDYPLVARLAPGVAVRVQGCLGDYSWCDVTFGGNRGWVYAGELGYAYESRRVPIVDYGPRIGLPIITFSLGNYWDHYYRGRPWYRERDQWEHRAWNDRQRYENNWRERNEHRYEQRNDYRDNNRRYEQRNEYRGNAQPFSNSQSEQFRRDREAGRDTTRDNAPRAGTMPPGSSPPPTTPGYYTGQQ